MQYKIIKQIQPPNKGATHSSKFIFECRRKHVGKELECDGEQKLHKRHNNEHSEGYQSKKVLSRSSQLITKSCHIHNNMNYQSRNNTLVSFPDGLKSLHVEVSSGDEQIFGPRRRATLYRASNVKRLL